MRMDFLARRSWFYFRMGNMILSWPFGFFGTITVIYELVLKQIPFFAFFRLWSFSIVFGIPYYILGVYLGILQIRRQSLMEGALAAPYSIYEYKMKPFGREALLGMPASLTGLKIQIRMLEWMDRVSRKLIIEMPELSAEFDQELQSYKKMTETLLNGGEIR